MALYLVEALGDTELDRTVVVTGPNGEAVAKKLQEVAPDLGLDFIEQPKPRGTGDAVAAGLTAFADDDYSGLDDEDDVVILPSNLPLLRPASIARLVRVHRERGSAATLLSVATAEAGSGRHLIRGRDDRVVALFDDATSPEIFTGVAIFRRSLLAPAIRRINARDLVGESDLGDVIEVLAETGHFIDSVILDDPAEILEVNDRQQLADAEIEIRRRTNRSWLARGVTMLDPERTYIDSTVELADDVTLFPGTILQGNTVVGIGAEVGPDSRLIDCAVGAGARVETTMAQDAEIGPGAHVGPFAVLEPGAQVAPDVVTGPFFAAGSSE